MLEVEMSPHLQSKSLFHHSKHYQYIEGQIVDQVGESRNEVATVQIFFGGEIFVHRERREYYLQILQNLFLPDKCRRYILHLAYKAVYISKLAIY